MNDDYHMRKSEYAETFVTGKKKIIKCEVAFTSKFCYITLQDTKYDLHYKLRLVEETGRALLERFRVYKLQFKDHIFRDQMKKYYLSAPFPTSERKFYFIPIEPSKVIEE